MITSNPSSTGVSLPTRYVSGRWGPAATSQRTSTIVWIRDAADQVPCREREVPRRGRGDRDRDLRQGAGDREQDQAAELVAETEPGIERVRRLRERMPAAHVAPAAARKIRSRRGEPSPATPENDLAAADGASRPPQR